MRVPLGLLTPRVLTFKNRWFSARSTLKDKVRSIVVLLMMVGVALGIYSCTVSALHDCETLKKYVDIRPAVPLSLLFLVIITMIFLSSCVSALGSLFLARDLDLILSLPARRVHFLNAKIAEVFLSSGWMLAVFGLPSLMAFGQVYNAPASFYLGAALLLIPFFIIPTSLAVMIATLFSAILPATRSREIMMIASLVSIVTGILYLEQADTGLRDPTSIQHLLAILHHPQKSWLPSHWLAKALEGLLYSDQAAIWNNGALLACAAVITWLASLLVLVTQYSFAFGRAQGKRSRFRLNSRRAQWLLRQLTPVFGPQARSIMAKEYKLFSRDITQAVQLMMLIAVCIIYLYNFRVLKGVTNIDEHMRAWWQAILAVCNVAMGSLILTAVSTRFVFPAISLEGSSFWILQSAPINIDRILSIKFWVWYLPVMFVATVIFASGACALDLKLPLLMWSVYTAGIVTLSIIGLSIGLGAIFANFDWEYSAQMSTSIGSLVFMLVATIVALINLVPFALVVALTVLLEEYNAISYNQWLWASLGTAILMTFLNAGIMSWALSAGARSLEARAK